MALQRAAYTPQQLLKMSLPEVSKIYTAERSKMSKRKKRLDKEGFNTNFQQWTDIVGGGEIPKLRDIKKQAGGDEQYAKQMIAYWTAELKQFDTEETTVKYQKERRRKQLETMKEHGYDLAENEYNDFIEFMDWVHNADLDMMLYSESYDADDVGYNELSDTLTGNEYIEEKRGDYIVKNPDRVMNLYKIWLENDRSLPVEFLLNR